MASNNFDAGRAGGERSLRRRSHGRSNRRTSWRWRLVALTAVFALVAGACSDAGSESDGKKVLTVAMPALGTMDYGPITSEEDNEKFLMLMGDNLVGLDAETGKISPELATSWSLSKDGRTWDFKLRPNVKFQGGWGTMTAEDVKFSWAQWIDSKSEHPNANVMRRAVSGNMDNFEVVSDLEFKLHAKTPLTSLLGLVCSCLPGMTVFPKAYYEKEGAKALKNPIGTGPWQYVSSKPGDRIVMKAFKDYWGEKPAADELVLLEIQDGASRLAQVRAGSVDMAHLDGSLVGEATSYSDLKVRAIPYIVNAFITLGGSYWGTDKLDRDAPWIQADEPEKGLAIREAMSLAIDRKLILDKALGGLGELSYGPIIQFPQVAALTDPAWDLPAFDKALAKQKLAEGGYPDGFPVEMPIYSGDIDTEAVGEAVAGMWGDIGLKVKRAPMEERRLDKAQAEYDTSGLAWVRITSFSAEPALNLETYTSGEAKFGNVKFLYPAIDQAVSDMNKETDLTKRYAIARQFLTTMRDNEIALPLFTGDMPFVTGPSIKDWDPMPGVNTVNRLNTVTFTDK